MSTKTITLIFTGLIITVSLFAFSRTAHKQENNSLAVNPPAKAHDSIFQSSGLKTNTAITSIPLDLVLDGGPGKDGIPALTNPKFTSLSDAAKFLKDDISGIKVTFGNTTRFYPYTILVWHEVVNDVIGGRHLVITFCPLCGSAIVFDATVGGSPEQFGVSGKLYDSNLLMYDKTTESLWSQIIGKAVVGDKTGSTLEIYPSQVITFSELKKNYPDAKVLSTDTGYTRDYNFYPYGDYNTNEKILFPVSVQDKRFPAKEIMYAVNFNNHSIAFKLSDLKKVGIAEVVVGNQKITAEEANGEITTKDSAGNVIPGYYAMWFAWAAQHQKDGVVK